MADREAVLYSATELHKRHGIEVTGPVRTALFQRHPTLTRKQRRELERNAARSLRAKLKRGFQATTS